MNQWNVALYEDKHSYVWQYGAKLLEILNPQPGESILDLGCGTGQLTAQIAATGAKVTGLDAADSAIASCRQNFPQLEFMTANGANFTVETEFDAVFSNAALHWIQPPTAVVQCIYNALKPKGRLVAEFGGKGNIKQITTAIDRAFGQPDYDPWYFPSIGEYSSLLEQQRFRVDSAVLFPRPTKLDGEKGLANWLKMFAKDRFQKVSEDTKANLIKQIEAELRPSLHHDGHWWADYCRIRIMATKIE